MPPKFSGEAPVQLEKNEYGMNKSQRQQARTLTAESIANGADPRGLVHVLFYPNDSSLSELEIQGLSTPLPAESSLDGYTSSYYTLAQLAG